MSTNMRALPHATVSRLTGLIEQVYLEHNARADIYRLAPAIGLGSPLIFDLGVFCVVIGVVVTMTFMLGEE